MGDERTGMVVAGVKVLLVLRLLLLVLVLLVGL